MKRNVAFLQHLHRNVLQTSLILARQPVVLNRITHARQINSPPGKKPAAGASFEGVPRRAEEHVESLRLLIARAGEI